jgi:hypothetical protein
MTFNFKTAPARNPTASIEVYNNDGDFFGKFTVREQSQYSPLFLKRLQDARKTLSPSERKRVESPKTEDDILLGRLIIIKNFVDHYLVDCEIPSDGDEVYTSKDAAMAYLSEPDNFWIFIEVDGFASEQGNFRKEAVEESKND